MSYQRSVKASLKDRANVYGPSENGRWSGYTLNTLRFWLPDMPDPDIVHWNNGLWDMGDDYHLGRPFTLPEEYEDTLDRTVRVLKQLCGERVIIIMATTTPTKLGKLEQIQKYNEILRRVAAKNGLEVNDLYACIAADLVNYVGHDNLHLSPEGVKLAAAQVTACLEKYL